MILDTSSQLISASAYAVVEQQEGQFLATVLGWPDISVVGNSRQEVIESLNQLVQERLDQAEIVPLALKVTKSPGENPWLKFAGRFANDEQFKQVIDEVETYRQELDQTNEDGAV